MSEKSWEIQSSVALDGELDATATIELLDAMAEDESCREQWQNLRAVDRALDPVIRPAARPLTAARPLRATRPRSRFLWLSAPAAAAALLAFLLLGPRLSNVDNLPDPGDSPLTVRLAANEGEMTEQRFVQLVVEVLQADLRFQQKLFEVLEEVHPEASRTGAGSGEGSPESSERLVLGHEEDPNSGYGELPFEALAGIH
ncbi:hypothetical protein DRQ53_02375 [bacterium]|nr:MAG: hypothetical protein DRQ53_02375 [bacterium]